MKLRNKKTGEIRELIVREDDAKLYDDSGTFYIMVDSLSELNEEWEDAEDINVPLIKDEKKHKIIRACASLDSVEDVKVVKRSSDDTTTLIFGKTTLTLKGREEYASLQQCGTYTIDELCGEEEE